MITTKSGFIYAGFFGIRQEQFPKRSIFGEKSERNNRTNRNLATGGRSGWFQINRPE
jgi:hypothetical protein